MAYRYRSRYVALFVGDGPMALDHPRLIDATNLKVTYWNDKQSEELGGALGRDGRETDGVGLWGLVRSRN